MLIAAVILGCFAFVGLLGYQGARRKDRALCWTPEHCALMRRRGHLLLVCNACLRGGRR